MKPFLAISTSTLLVIGILSITTAGQAQVDVITQSHENLFVLKASRKFKGTEVEVLSSSGYLVSSQKLTRRKLIIDFKNVRAGSYLIKVKKGNDQEEFQFVKK